MTWAVVVDTPFPRMARAAAFVVERETAQFLIGDAFYRQRQPKEMCRRFESEAEAKAFARAIEDSRAEAENTIDNARAAHRTFVNNAMQAIVT